MYSISNEQLSGVISNFKICGNVKNISPYGNGHINDTFMITADIDGTQERKYILQRINTAVFKNPSELMRNIERVTSYLKDKTSSERETLTLVPTVDGKIFYTDGNSLSWRIYNYIDNSVCIELPDNNDDFYQCAVVFGKFQRYLDGFPADELYEVIPDFHNTPKRYNDFLKAVNDDICGRASTVSEEISFIKSHKDFYSCLIENNKSGLLPLRVCHNDTKCNNAMLDRNTHKALCAIDLDTVMPGFSVTDFGDSIRFGASTAAEDEKDTEKVLLDIDKFKTYTKGYLDGCGGMLKDSEIMLLPEGAKIMTIECGMRFLTDYLNGDTYFKTAYPEHNLVRCRTQIKLVKEMEKHWDILKETVKGYTKEQTI